MSAVADSLRKIAATSEKPAKKSKKSASTEEVDAEVVVEEEGKKAKKDKKDKKRDRDSVAPIEDEVVADAEPKKSKKKKVIVKHSIVAVKFLSFNFNLPVIITTRSLPQLWRILGVLKESSFCFQCCPTLL